MFFKKKHEKEKQTFIENGRFLAKRFSLAWKNDFLPQIKDYEDFDISVNRDYAQGEYRFSFASGDNAFLEFTILGFLYITHMTIRFNPERETFAVSAYRTSINGFGFKSIKEVEIYDLHDSLSLNSLSNEIWDEVLEDRINIHHQYNDLEQVNTYKNKLKNKQMIGVE